VQCREEGEMKGWGDSTSAICVWKKYRKLHTVLPWCCLPFVLVLFLVVLCELLFSCLVCIVMFMCTCCAVCIDAGLLARSQYLKGPATSHLNTGFSWFPSFYKQMLRWFPKFQVVTTCFSRSPPKLNLLVTNVIFCIHVK